MPDDDPDMGLKHVVISPDKIKKCCVLTVHLRVLFH
jgi:hypothetical protein